MTAYLIANYDITNKEGFQPYGAASVRTLKGYGGKLLVAGFGSEAVEGSPRAITTVIEFPSMEALRNWYDSPEYQAIIALRIDNTEGNMVFANEFVMPRRS